MMTAPVVLALSQPASNNMSTTTGPALAVLKVDANNISDVDGPEVDVADAP